MKISKNRLKQWLAFILSLSLLLSLVPIQTFANEDDGSPPQETTQLPIGTYTFDENGNMICAECGAVEGHTDECQQTVTKPTNPVVEEIENEPTTDVVCTCYTETDIHDNLCPLYKAVEIKCTCNIESNIHNIECPLYEEIKCTCETENDIHTNECPLYVEEKIEKKDEIPETTAPEEITPTCSCNTETDVHEESCELYVELDICDECSALNGEHAETCSKNEIPIETVQGGDEDEFLSDIYLDLTYGDIKFTDTTFSGFNSLGEAISGEHKADNVYNIIQTNPSATSNTISVGTSSTPVTTTFEIHLCSINIDAPKTTSNHKAAIYVNTSSDNVYLVVEDGSTNILKAYGKIFTNGNKSALLSESQRFGHAAIEKEINTQGTLIVTCNEGLTAYKNGNTNGHNCSSSGNCGYLEAYSIGEAAFNTSGNTRTSAAAAIGSRGEFSATSDKRTSLTNAPTMGTLYNLVIAGGKIKAVGTKGNANSDVYLGGSPGIGVGAGFQQYSVGFNAENIRITGGNINAIAGDGSSACIGGGYHAGYVKVNIYGGTINATSKLTNSKDSQRGAGIGGGGGGSTSNATAGATVNIYNGTITATSEYGAAIGAGAGGSKGTAQPAIINIYGGYITASTTKGNGLNGAGAAIGAGGSLGTGYGGKATILIAGGTVNASSELGADIGGGGTNSTEKTGVGGEGIITITGGTITAMSGGIGGGNANAGVGGNATLTISGGTINASKVNGGNSKQNNGGRATVVITNGTINTGSIGGGICTESVNGKIGSAEVTISGGKIYGQIIMDSTNLGSGEKCYFKMNGGVIDLTNPNNGFTFNQAQPNGAAVYIVGSGNSTEAIAQMTNGTIKNANASYGGAIYIAGGGSMLMSGGSIESCNAVNNGGAVYIDNGTFTMNGGEIKNCTAQNGGAIYINDGLFTMADGNFNNNSSTNGGSVYVNGGTFEISNGQFTNNESDYGGAVYVNNGTFTVRGGEFKNNLAINGGAAYVSGGNIDIFNGLFDGNEAITNGGAIYVNTNSVDVKINVYDGVITNNTAGNHAGAIGANASGNYAIELNIGLESCKGENCDNHSDGTCPVINNNTASRLGGAFCLHGESQKLFVNIYCGSIKGNIAIKNSGSNTLNQGGGHTIVWGGKIDPGIMVGGGIYDDNRVNEEQIYIRFWANYDGGPTDPVIVEVTYGITMVFPVDTYEWAGHELSGWASAPDNSGLYIPANGQYSIQETEDGYLDFYAAWDAVTSYIVYIPETMPIDNQTQAGNMDISAQLNYFKANSTLNIYVNGDFKLTNPSNTHDIWYDIYSSEFGDHTIIGNNEIVATFQYNNHLTKRITSKIKKNQELKYSDIFTDVLTFIVEYAEIQDD